MSPFVRTRQRGFTLIELLVVISIIGFLSSIALASFDSARARARDAQRIQALNQLKTALEAYRSDFGDYPQILTADGTAVSCVEPSSVLMDSAQGLAMLVPKYISKLPKDPINTSGSCYWYVSRNSNYYSALTCEGKVTEYHLSFKPEKTLNLPRVWVNGAAWNPARYCVVVQ